jgi:hypothetical protein
MEGLGSVKQEMLRKQDQCSPASHNNRSLALLERCGTENGYLNEARRGSVRPSGLRIKRAGA